jgi:hypothetical protein
VNAAAIARRKLGGSLCLDNSNVSFPDSVTQNSVAVHNWLGLRNVEPTVKGLSGFGSVPMSVAADRLALTGTNGFALPLERGAGEYHTR